MKAETLNCPTCGAAASTESTRCLFCNARLATVACPDCFAMMFVGSLHCSRCGAKAEREEAKRSAAALRNCPRCRVPLDSVMVGSAGLRECARCGGLWVDVESFERIISEREDRAVVLGAASIIPKQEAAGAGEPNKVRYVPCPVCQQLMNRVNFARCSGVIVDVCKGHGTWFDQDELQRIVEFVRGGGLELSRAREWRDIEEERQRLRQDQLTASLHEQRNFRMSIGEDRRSGIVSAARELLKLMLD